VPSRAEASCHASLERSRERRLRAARRRRLQRGARSAAAALLAGLSLAAGGAAAHEATGGTAAGAPPRAAGTGGVVALQRALGVAADGIYGPLTRRAVRTFQRRNGLRVTGRADAATLRALGLRARATTRRAAASTGAPARPGASALLERIARCESGGNPAAVSATGRYRGKYQFSLPTWRALGGTGDPAAAPEAEQDRRAAELLARAGTTPWPSCA